jgi:hypothetical protein
MPTPKYGCDGLANEIDGNVLGVPSMDPMDLRISRDASYRSLGLANPTRTVAATKGTTDPRDSVYRSVGLAKVSRSVTQQECLVVSSTDPMAVSNTTR